MGVTTLIHCLTLAPNITVLRLLRLVEDVGPLKSRVYGHQTSVYHAVGCSHSLRDTIPPDELLRAQALHKFVRSTANIADVSNCMLSPQTLVRSPPTVAPRNSALTKCPRGCKVHCSLSFHCLFLCLCPHNNTLLLSLGRVHGGAHAYVGLSGGVEEPSMLRYSFQEEGHSHQRRASVEWYRASEYQVLSAVVRLGR